MEEGDVTAVPPATDAVPRPPPPLSPLTGCYLLVVVGEPHSDRHKELIIQQLKQGLLSWDCSDCHVDLEKELTAIVASKPEGEEVRFGERLVQFATENLVTEILIHPQLNTLQQCLKNLLSSFTKHRHIIHAGYTFRGNGSWILQDGTVSVSDMVDALHEPEVLRVLRAYEGTVSVFIHCAEEGKWSSQRFQSEPVSKLCKVLINPPEVIPETSEHIRSFLDYVSTFLLPTSLASLLQPTEVVGNIRFTHPTLYVFPGGQGDAALFGINGFNMLVDGGFARKACFWDFARHLDRLDAVLLTRINNSTVQGIAAVLRRKKMNHVYPQIGHFFCNLQDRKISLSPEGLQADDSLIVSLAQEGREIVTNLRHLALKPHPCYRDGHQVDPVNLYHKVGHGKLDMYVISPARDSRVVKEFLAKWQDEDSDLFASASRKIGGKGFDFPLQNLVSICALLVWQPANPEDTITRILFPGSTPQEKVFEGIEKLRHLEFLKHPVCSARTVTPSASAVPLVKKILSKKPVTPVQKLKPKPKVTKEVKKIDTNKLVEETVEVEKTSGVERIIADIEKIDEVKKLHKSKYDMRNVKSKVDSRAPSKSIERKAKTEPSPPITPKKIIKPEKPKTVARIKTSPTSTPAKSAKDANNRKVVEARVVSKTVAKPKPVKETPPPPEKKPISRKPAAMKSAPRRAIKKLPIDLLEKASTDSTVSTPSADAETVAKRGKRAEAKTEDKRVAETEETELAVKVVSGKDDEEYLIVTKEEESVKDDVKEGESCQEEAETEGEGEIKKLQRDELDSEKKRMEEEKKDSSGSPPQKDQPDEKFSTTLETSATTAPTLPEDERVPLEGLKEEEREDVVEEKYIKEETKEKTPERPEQLPPVESEPPKVKVSHKDLVKTPDEVADLPVHEEVDPTMYASSEFTRDLQPKEDQAEDTVKGEEDAEEPEKPKAGPELEESPVEEPAEKASDDKEAKISPVGSGKISPDLVEAKLREGEEIMPEEKASPEMAPLETQEPPREQEVCPAVSEKDGSPERSPTSENLAKEEPIGSPELIEALASAKVILEEDGAKTSAKTTPGETSPEPLDKKEASGKTSPGEVPSPEHAAKGLVSSEAPSGKTSPEPKDEPLEGASSRGKTSPGPVEEKESLETTSLATKEEAHERESSAKTTPGKTSPVEGSRVGSGRTSPIGKASPVAPESSVVLQQESSAKTTPGKMSPVEGSRVGSGRTSPSGKASQVAPESSVALQQESSAKTTPGKMSPVEGKSQVSSGRTSPSGKASPVVLESSAKTTPGKASPEPEEKSRASSGRTSPSPEPTKTLGKVETEEVTKEGSRAVSGSPSGEVSPVEESPKKKVESPEPMEGKKDLESGGPSPSGQASPDLKEPSGKESPEPADTQVKGSVEATPVATSGKGSPEPSEIPHEKDSPKAAPASPEPCGQKTSPEKLIQEPSGKTTPEASGKTSPEPPPKSQEISTPIASGKQTPTHEVSGKTSPEPETTQALTPPTKTPLEVSGKTSPEPQATSALTMSSKTSPEASGKTSPEPQATSALTMSSKTSPEASGKTSPEPPASQAQTKTPLEVSRKTSPEPPGSQALTPPTKTPLEGSGKTSPEPQVSPTPSPSTKTPPEASGKTSPEPQTSPAPTPSTKTSLEASGKASPEPQTTLAPTPSSKTSQEASGKTSPEGLASQALTSPTKTPLEGSGMTSREPQVSPSTKTPLEVSGKTSPEPQATPAPTPSSKTTLEASGKMSPEPPTEPEISPDPKEVTPPTKTPPAPSGQTSLEPRSELEVIPDPKEATPPTPEASGKTSPEPQSEPKISLPAPTKAKTSEASPLASGKQTPLDPTTPKSSGKATPESFTFDEISDGITSKSCGKAMPIDDINSSNATTAQSSRKASPEPPSMDEVPFNATKSSGKASPDLKHVEETPELSSDQRISTDVSDKDLKPLVSSGKASPAPQSEQKMSPVGSGKQSPTELKPSAHASSGKASPEPQSEQKMSPVGSGKQSPTELKPSAHASSGKASPEPQSEQKMSPVGSGKQSPTELKPSAPAISGKTSPEPQSEQKMSPVGSGKQTPTELKPSAHASSGKTSPEPQSEQKMSPVGSGKQTPTELKPSAHASSGKTSPEPQSEQKMSPVGSGKQTPTELKPPGSSAQASPEPPRSPTDLKPPESSGKASPEPLSEPKIGSGSSAPGSSGKASPEPPRSPTDHKPSSPELELKSEQESRPAGSRTPTEQKAAGSSGKASPEPPRSPTDLKPSSPELGLKQESSPVGSRTPTEQKAPESQASPEPPLNTESELEASGKKPEPSPKSSGKQTPTDIRSSATTPGKTSPEPLVKDQEGKTTPGSSTALGQTSPDPTAKAEPPAPSSALSLEKVEASIPEAEPEGTPNGIPKGEEIAPPEETSREEQKMPLLGQSEKIVEASPKKDSSLEASPTKSPAMEDLPKKSPALEASPKKGSSTEASPTKSPAKEASPTKSPTIEDSPKKSPAQEASPTKSPVTEASSKMSPAQEASPTKSPPTETLTNGKVEEKDLTNGHQEVVAKSWSSTAGSSPKSSPIRTPAPTPTEKSEFEATLPAELLDEDGVVIRELRRLSQTGEEASEKANGVEKGILEAGEKEKPSSPEQLQKTMKDDANENAKISPQSATKESTAAKDHKDDINEQMKKTEESTVTRMLVTASSEDGGTETDLGEDFSSLVEQAKAEYEKQRSRKSSASEEDAPFEGSPLKTTHITSQSGEELMTSSFYGSLPEEAKIEPIEEEDIDFARALDEHRSARGEDLTDPVSGWGKPLGLPGPPKNFGQNISTTSSLSTPTDNSESVTNWGQPMSLPQPAPPEAEEEAKETPKKTVKKIPGRRAESPKGKVPPLYVDLSYVPHHGNSYYSNVEFFKRVRARYYVFSGTEPSKEVYNALLEAKASWEDKELEVTIIPTYDTDVLGYWVAENEEALAKHKIDLSPSASRCTINLQDHETSCSAYRLEF